MGSSCMKKKNASDPKSLSQDGEGDVPRDYMPRNFSIKLREVPKTATNKNDDRFALYYNKIITKALKFFKDSTTVDGLTFENRLAINYGVSVEYAKVWVSAYIDYMIMVGWDINRKSTVAHYSSVYIQLVTRLHILFGENYLEFSKILTDGAGPIHFAPCSLVVHRDETLLEQMASTYQQTKQSIMSHIYSASDMAKSGEEIKNAGKLWDSFMMTVVKNEFKFHFQSRDQMHKFQDMLLQDSKSLPLKNNTLENIIFSSDKVRELQGLDQLNQTMIIPNIIEDFKSSPKGGILTEVMKIDGIKFPTDMITLLAWENNLSVSDALKWILEYKKFMFLVLMTGSKKTLMVPSLAVDTTWKTHMQYTESYHHEISFFKYPPQYKFRGIKEDSDILHYYRVTMSNLDSYFKTIPENIWPTDYQPETRTWGIFHIFFGSQLMELDKKRSAISKFNKSKKSKEVINLSSTFDADIIDTLKANRRFFDITYEEEDSVLLEPSLSVSPMGQKVKKSKDNNAERASQVDKKSTDSTAKYLNYN